MATDDQKNPSEAKADRIRLSNVAATVLLLVIVVGMALLICIMVGVLNPTL